MSENESINQIPIISFLNKHKWRIMIPLLFALFYWAIPRYMSEPIAVQQYIFFKSDVLTNEEIKKEFFINKEKVHGDEYLKALIIKYDLFQLERSKRVSESKFISKLRYSIHLSYSDYQSTNSASVWINLNKENSKNILPLSKQVLAEFEQNPKIHSEKFVSDPYDSNYYRSTIFWGSLAQGFVFLVIPLVILWEIPNLFYSQKMKDMVFDPIKSDWQEEANEAKLEKNFIKLIFVHIRYSFAFVLALIQESPFGKLFEFVYKLAK